MARLRKKLSDLPPELVGEDLVREVNERFQRVETDIEAAELERITFKRTPVVDVENSNVALVDQDLDPADPNPQSSISSLRDLETAINTVLAPNIQTNLDRTRDKINELLSVLRDAEIIS
jgi:hypothetical protein